MLFRKKSTSDEKCKHCEKFENEVHTLRRAFEAKDKLHRKELAILTDEITALRLINEKLMKEE